MNAQQESVVLQHYGPAGSASPDWLRACREIEAAEDFAASPVEPLPALQEAA